jgi:HK97 family phage major capsid protein
MPAIGGSAKPIAFGDFARAYTIVDRVNVSIMRDPFSQATSGNIRYVARKRVGGAVVLAEAIQLQNISA